jgi:D-arabinose 1-dehydrogenase-like Zn-dependent alcohol dehydrogenase
VAAALNRLDCTGRVGNRRQRQSDEAVIDGLAVRARLVVIGVDAEPIEVSSVQPIGASRSVVGHAAGTAMVSEDTLPFSVLSGARPIIETTPLARAQEA